MENTKNDAPELQRIPLIYVAGPYRAPTRFETEANIHAAESYGIKIAKMGAYPVIPHANTRGYFEDTQPDHFWLRATLRLMHTCSAVMFMPNWHDSQGARLEHAQASSVKMPIFTSLADLNMFVRCYV
jgi:hypothetical protein